MRQVSWMENWNEVRTALKVAKLGSISAAATHLNVHRATVLRHIEALESHLSTKLFIRNSKGYIPTEAGESLVRVAQITEEQFAQYTSRTKGENTQLSGDFVITSIDALTPYLLDSVKEFQAKHPQIKVTFVSDETLSKLEYGQVHIAIRTGPKPQKDDYVVQPFIKFTLGLYAHNDYVKKYGQPKNLKEFKDHVFVTSDAENTLLDFQHWLIEHAPDENISFCSNRFFIQLNAIYSAMGIGFSIQHETQPNPDMIPILHDQYLWTVENWIVTHGDMHRSDKVQSFLAILKGNFAGQI